MNSYLDLARQGKTTWRHYALAVVLILFLWQILGAIPSAFLILWVWLDGKPQTDVTSSGQFIGVDPNLGFVMPMLGSVLFLIGIFLAIHFIHQRPIRTLVTPASHGSWGRFFQGFAVWFILLGLMSLVEVLLYPGRYTWTLNLHYFVPFVFLAILLIPLQTSAEELFFRGYILQGVGLRLRNIWLLSAISGFLFMMPHLLNPEARVNYPLMGFYYFFIGPVMAYITLRDGRLELALGLHSANNLFSALLANYTGSVMPTPSLYTINTLDAVYSVSAAFIGLVVFVFVFTGPFRRTARGENNAG